MAWLDEAPDDIFTTAITLTTAITAADFAAGVAVLPDGRRRDSIGLLIERMIDETFARMILPFGVDCTPAYARIVASRKAAGRPIATADAQIAAIGATAGAALATRNTKDFTGIDLDLIDPWNAGRLQSLAVTPFSIPNAHGVFRGHIAWSSGRSITQSISWPIPVARSTDLPAACGTLVR